MNQSRLTRRPLAVVKNAARTDVGDASLNGLGLRNYISVILAALTSARR